MKLSKHQKRILEDICCDLDSKTGLGSPNVTKKKLLVTVEDLMVKVFHLAVFIEVLNMSPKRKETKSRD